jgi:hypothetical protein
MKPPSEVVFLHDIVAGRVVVLYIIQHLLFVDVDQYPAVNRFPEP